jgi:MioC protein
MAPITILVGTMTGNAEFAAEDMQAVLREDHGCEVDFVLMDTLRADVFKRNGVFLVCTSTYGEGEVPDNARDFYETLCAQRPDLTGVRYGVFGLGDSTYRETFNHGGKRFDDLLTELGARRLGERAKHDASLEESASDYARKWVSEWIEAVRADLDKVG